MQATPVQEATPTPMLSMHQMIRAMTFKFMGQENANLSETKQVVNEMLAAEAGKVFKLFIVYGLTWSSIDMASIIYLECVIPNKSQSKKRRDTLIFNTVRCTATKQINGISIDDEDSYTPSYCLVEQTDRSTSTYDMQAIFRAPEDAALTEKLISIVSKFTDLGDVNKTELAKQYIQHVNATSRLEIQLKEMNRACKSDENKRVKISSDAEIAPSAVELLRKMGEERAKSNYYHYLLLDKAYGIFEEFQQLLKA